jgi:uncharacterized delta-60 repeat protein
LAILADGRILVAGQTLSDDLSVADMAFARYTSSGALDPSFGAAGKATVDLRGTVDNARALTILGSGKILAGGTSRDPAGSRLDMAAVRLSPDGAIDSSFGVSGSFVSAYGGPGSQTVNDVAQDPSGRVVLGGTYGTSTANDFGALRLSPTGVPDSAFGAAGLATVDFQGRDDYGNVLLQDERGDYLLAGVSLATNDHRVGIVRLLPNGRPDPTFGAAGKTLTPLPNALLGSSFARAGALERCSVVVVGSLIESANGLSRVGAFRYFR